MPGECACVCDLLWIRKTGPSCSVDKRQPWEVDRSKLSCCPWCVS
jgi:hypothetical protein